MTRQKRSTRVAVVQTNPRLGRTEENIRRCLALMARQRAHVYVLPELAFSGYNFASKRQARALAEPAGLGASYEALWNFARQRAAYVAYGFPERFGGTLYNSASLLGPRGLIGTYRKVHLFGREKLFFRPGKRFPVYDLPFGRVGLMVCYDWFFPEAMRTLALKGAQLILHPANLVLPHCPDSMRTRCLENRVFAATADRVGTETGGGRSLTYIGQSQVVSPDGQILTRLGRREGASAVSCDLGRAKDKTINRWNHLFKDRRPERYRL